MNAETVRLPLILVILLELLFGGCSAATAAQQAPPAPVVVAEAKPAVIGQSIMATGAVASRNDARLAAEVAGRLEWIAEPGRTLRRGEVAARIDDARLALTLRDNRAAVKRLEANVRLLETQRQRLEPLLAQSIVSRSQYDEADARVQMARQELEQARVARDLARLELERATVRAPFDGAVAERLQQAGEYVAAGGALLRLVDTRNVEVVARAPLAAMNVARGQAVQVRDEERSVASAVRSIVPVGDERSRLLEIRVALRPAAWPIGAPVRVELPGRQASGVTVPRDAVILRRGEAYVYRINGDGTAERVPVRVGAGRAGEVQVTGNIRAGDRVVVRGGETLQPGQSVVVQGRAARDGDERVAAVPSATG